MKPYAATTRVLVVDPAAPDAAVIAEAAAVVRAGGLVAFPTETVYGLGASALDAAAVARVFAAKGRPSSDPLIVHLASPADLGLVALDPPAAASALAARFWPGPLTLVLRRQPHVPAEISAGRDTVAVRVPSHPVALALIAAAGPLVAPSANLFSRPSPTSAAHVLEDLRGRVDVVLDGGATAIGIESTVVDLTADPPALLRPGGVPAEALRALLPGLSYAPRYMAADGEAAPAPGMLLKHYSPRARLTLYAGPRAAALARMRADAQELAGAGGAVGLMAPDEEAQELAGAGQVCALGPADDLAQIAARLFGAMRELDAAGVDAILARAPEHHGLGLAIWDRLLRAAEGRVIEP